MLHQSEQENNIQKVKWSGNESKIWYPPPPFPHSPNNEVIVKDVAVVLIM